MTDTHPLEPAVRDYLHRRVNEGVSFVKTRQIAASLDVTSHDLLPVVKRLKHDGTLEVWSGSNPTTYRVTNGGQPDASSAVGELTTDGSGKARCGAPTKNGGACGQPAVGPIGRCPRHVHVDGGDDTDNTDARTEQGDRPVWERQHDELLGGEQ